MTTWARPRWWRAPLPGECYMRHEDCAQSLELRMACENRYVDAVRRMFEGQKVRFHVNGMAGDGIIGVDGDGVGFYVIGRTEDGCPWSGWVYPLSSGRLEPL